MPCSSPISLSDVKDTAFAANMVLDTTSTRVLKPGFSERGRAPRQTPQQRHLEPQNHRNVSHTFYSTLSPFPDCFQKYTKMQFLVKM